MFSFVARRLVLMFPVLVGILVVTFSLARLIPGDPCYVMLGERATETQCSAFRDRFGLNDSLPVQFTRYVTSIAQGDFGTSIRDKRPIVDIIAERLPMTMELTVGAMLLRRLLACRWGSSARCGITARLTWAP